MLPPPPGYSRFQHLVVRAIGVFVMALLENNVKMSRRTREPKDILFIVVEMAYALSISGGGIFFPSSAYSWFE